VETTELELQTLARRALTTWGLKQEPQRVELGVNKAAWRVDDYWLTSDVATAADRVRRLAAFLGRVENVVGQDVVVPGFVASDLGPVVELGDRVWWLTRNVEGRHPKPAEPADMAAVARGLARIHDALRQLPAEDAVSTDTLLGLFRAGAELVSDPRLAFSPSELETARVAADLVQVKMKQLYSYGMQITHGDPSNPNLFVDGSPSQLVGAIDWDYARYDLVLSDLATVAQTLLFRSKTQRPREYVAEVTAAYVDAGGADLSTDEVLVGVLMVLFEAVAHHGRRFLEGQADHTLISGRVANMRTVLSLLER
jgi:Ser/Thr protein kinase RdoA (MazF antagonist)